MFEEHGLNVARQPDNGANPRPDNRSGWLDGETPDVVEELLATSSPRSSRTGDPRRDGAAPLNVRLWDPSTQLRYRAKRTVAAPDDAATAPPDRARSAGPRAGRRQATDERASSERLAELERLGLDRRLRLVSGPQGPTVLLDGRPVLLLCSNNYLGLADHPRVREAAADAAMRWGVGAGASRLVSGTMTIHRRLEERLAAFERQRGVPAVRLRLPREHRRDRRARRRAATRSSPTSSTTPRSSTAAASRAPRSSSTATSTSNTSSGACAATAAAARPA